MRKNHLRVVEGLILRKRPDGTRPIREVALDIQAAWPKINPYADSYLQAMLHIERIEDCYGLDTAEGIVLRFLANAQSFRGEKAKELKAELKAILKTIDRELADENHKAVYR